MAFSLVIYISGRPIRSMWVDRQRKYVRKSIGNCKKGHEKLQEKAWEIARKSIGNCKNEWGNQGL